MRGYAPRLSYPDWLHFGSAPAPGDNVPVTLSRKTLFAGAIALAFAAAADSPPRTFALQGLSPRFWNLVDRSAKLDKVAGGFGFTEGPVWDEKGFLYVSDEEQNYIYRLFTDGKREKVVALGDPDGSTYDRRHRLIDCASVLRAIIAVQPNGKYQILADRYQGKRFNSPNDVVEGPDGALYFTDPTLDLPKGDKQELAYQGVFRLGTDGRVTLLTTDLSQPNGLAFSPDGKKFYVDDSDRRDIRVYDTGRGGTISNGRVFGTENGDEKSGVPDGIRVDVNGNLFVTGPQGIWVWSPDGQHLGTIAMPEQPANLTWGDADHRTLYITATTSVYRLKTRTTGFIPWLAAK